MTPERSAGASPALVMLVAGVVVAVLCFAEARRIDRNAARGRRTPVRPHSAHTGTATGDTAAIAHHDKEQQMTDLFAENASPDAIRHEIKKARATRDRWERRVTALAGLLDQRLGQIEAGTWPPNTPTGDAR